MDTLKKIFPFSFGAKDVVALVVKIIIYIIAPAILGVATWIVGLIPVVGAIICAIVGVLTGLIGLYVLIGIILAILDYCKVLK